MDKLKFNKYDFLFIAIYIIALLIVTFLGILINFYQENPTEFLKTVITVYIFGMISSGIAILSILDRDRKD